MKVKDIINSDLIESDMYVIIRRADSFCAIAEGEQHEDHKVLRPRGERLHLAG